MRKAAVYACVNLDDRSVSTLTTEWDNFPSWSPGGDRILFTRQRSTDQDFDIYTIKPDGSDLRQVTKSPGADGHATWTADGKQIFVASARTGFKDEAALYDTSPQPYAQIFLMNPDGSNARQLTDSRWEDSMPVYVPCEYQRESGDEIMDLFNHEDSKDTKDNIFSFVFSVSFVVDVTGSEHQTEPKLQRSGLIRDVAVERRLAVRGIAFLRHVRSVVRMIEQIEYLEDPFELGAAPYGQPLL